MSEIPAYLALIESASLKGVERRRRYLFEHGPHELGWSYANILEVGGKLLRQIAGRGFFRLFLYVPRDDNGSVLFRTKITALTTYRKPEIFNDPVERKRYLVHSRMMISAIEPLERPMPMDSFRSADRRKPDVRHLKLGFLFVVDPEP